MSKLEQEIAEQFKQRGITSIPQQRIPLDAWPWKRPRSHRPKCDFYLPQSNIYVEVKGFMTIHAMAKMSWLCRQKELNYYIFQATEEDWDPYLLTPCPQEDVTLFKSDTEIVNRNIVQQVKELVLFSLYTPEKTSEISLARLRKYIGRRVSEYEEWNGERLWDDKQGESIRCMNSL